MAKKAKKRKSKVKKTKRAAARRPKTKTKRPLKKAVRKTKAVKPKTKKPVAKKAAPKKPAALKSKTYKILLMGASYGSLLASKLLFGGHSIHLVCLPAEADLINAEGFKVRLPVRGRSEPVLLESRKLPGKVTAGPATGVNPKDYDLIGLCMQEPQYRSPGVRELLDAVGKSRVPCMSIMNMPPLPYVKRIPGLDHKALEAAYTDPRVWDSVDPKKITLNSPDPQAIRPPDGKANELLVTLPTNFKCARFDNDKDTAIVRQLEKDVEAARFDAPEGKIELPVKLQGLRVRSSCRSPSGRCCAPAIIAASRRTACARRKRRCIPISRSRARSTISLTTFA